MEKNNFQEIINANRLLYQCIVGSQLYNLQMEDGSSDVDSKGIYLAPKNAILGLGLDYQAQVSDERHDNTWYELGEFCKLLLKSNPTVLELLFIPPKKMITPPSDIIMPLFENKDQFITKECFKPFVEYGRSQISKARGLNKKIVNPVTERLTPFDFAYTFYSQGSTKIKNWLENRGLNKDFCGLVRIPNMHDTYGVYYDWGAHFEANNIKSFEDIKDEKLARFIRAFYELGNVPSCEEMMEERWFEEHKGVLHYRGMCLENATDMRGSSVSKGEKPLCHMVYNESGFKDHCKKYKEYKDWEKFRNPKRYESNLDKNYDSKNLMHCVRLMHMGKEIAEGQGIHVERTWDKEFLMDIRNHKFEYDELMEKIEADREALDKAIANSTIKETIDINFVNEILIEMRKKAYHL